MAACQTALGKCNALFIIPIMQFILLWSSLFCFGLLVSNSLFLVFILVKFYDTCLSLKQAGLGLDVCLENLVRRAFSVAGPTVWNSLPEDMRIRSVLWTGQLHTVTEDIFIFAVLVCSAH